MKTVRKTCFWKEKKYKFCAILVCHRVLFAFEEQSYYSDVLVKHFQSHSSDLSHFHCLYLYCAH